MDEILDYLYPIKSTNHAQSNGRKEDHSQGQSINTWTARKHIIPKPNFTKPNKVKVFAESIEEQKTTVQKPYIQKLTNHKFEDSKVVSMKLDPFQIHAYKFKKLIGKHQFFCKSAN